jgi:hypothetical protein
VRLNQALALNIPGHTPAIFEQPIEIGSGDSDEATQDRRPKGRGPQMLSDGLPHAPLASDVAAASSSADGAAATATTAPRALLSPERSVSVTSGNRLSRAII